MKLEDARRDHYRKMAREQGYKSRAAYKLLEEIRKYKLIKRGDVVLDFGAAPGGWLQVASTVVGEQGLVVGVDLDRISLREENLETIQSDVRAPNLPLAIEKSLPRQADVVLSDLSPHVIGTWDLDHNRQVELTLAAISLMARFLRVGGNAMFKIFDGDRFGEVRAELKRRFETVQVKKPDASRKGSSELYLVCLGYSPEDSLTALKTSE